MPKHAFRLILLMAVFVVAALVIRMLIVDKSYYKYGYYRGDAVKEIAQDKPKYQGSESCKSCHAVPYDEWSKSIHNNADAGKVVKCEVCHGPGGGRDPAKNYMHATTGPSHPANLKLSVPTDTQALCTLCHERIVGRPVQQPQIVVKEHAGGMQCAFCHDSHSPLTFRGSFAAPEHPGDVAAGKNKTESCVRCHGAEGISDDLPGPTLAGQNHAYLIAAMMDYKNEKRDDPKMNKLTAALSDGDIADIAAYYSGLKCNVTAPSAEQTEAAGKAGAAVCAKCHGVNGIGADRGWPNLAGLSKDYFTDSMTAYADGDRPGAAMAALAKNLSEADVENLATYYAAYNCK